MRATIGAQLRAMHEDIVQEGVPDRFRELLDRLDKSQGKD
ncbi:MAG TPA: NepR family anti-sigma factor [Bauldia sp.]|nr:NepR family anti-sigma factor [Bauldia sp.]